MKLQYSFSFTFFCVFHNFIKNLVFSLKKILKSVQSGLVWVLIRFFRSGPGLVLASSVRSLVLKILIFGLQSYLGRSGLAPMTTLFPATKITVPNLYCAIIKTEEVYLSSLINYFSIKIHYFSFTIF